MKLVVRLNDEVQETATFKSKAEMVKFIADSYGKDRLEEISTAMARNGRWSDGYGRDYEFVGFDERYAMFQFEEMTFIVKYRSCRDIGNVIEDAISSYDVDEDVEYEDVVTDIMDSFNVEWEFVQPRIYRI